MNQALIGRRTYQVPGRFAELSPRQYVAVVQLLHAELTPLELKLRLTLVLLDVRRRPFLFWQLHRMSAEKRYELTELADFCLKEPRFTQQLLPVLRLPGGGLLPGLGQRVHGPATSFGNLCFAEFIEAEGHFAGYPRNPDALDYLVATLYRPAARQPLPTDVRQAYAPHTVADRAALVAQLPLAVRLAVRLWYASCRGAWVRKYTGTLFTKPDEAAGERPADPRETWREILAERAGSPVNYDDYGRQPVPNIFFDLDVRIRRREAEKETSQTRR
jgi:hypothetical protein